MHSIRLGSNSSLNNVCTYINCSPNHQTLSCLCSRFSLSLAIHITYVRSYIQKQSDCCVWCHSEYLLPLTVCRFVMKLASPEWCQQLPFWSTGPKCAVQWDKMLSELEVD